MGEAFITRRGGGAGATIQHIVATNATSLTFPLSNFKRSKCLVFGVYEYTVTSYNGMGFLSSAFEQRCFLGGDVFDRYRTTTSFENNTATVEHEAAISSGFFTRNADSVTLTIGHTAGGSDGAMGTKYTNTIDIYVVDYD